MDLTILDYISSRIYRNVRKLVLDDKLFLTYLLTYSMEHIPSSETSRLSATQEIPHILWNQKFITPFTSAHHLFLSLVSSIQSKFTHLTS